MDNEIHLEQVEYPITKKEFMNILTQIAELDNGIINNETSSKMRSKGIQIAHTDKETAGKWFTAADFMDVFNAMFQVANVE